MKRKTVKKIRRIYLFFSILLGVISPLLCIYLFPEFDPRIHPVSYFGILKNTSLIFILSLICFSIAILWNGITIIRKLIKYKPYQRGLKIILTTSSICLFLTGVIPMNFGAFHNIPALCFFALIIFLFFCLVLLELNHMSEKDYFRSSQAVSCYYLFY